jgi:hypothetical protein
MTNLSLQAALGALAEAAPEPQAERVAALDQRLDHALAELVEVRREAVAIARDLARAGSLPVSVDGLDYLVAQAHDIAACAGHNVPGWFVAEQTAQVDALLRRVGIDPASPHTGQLEEHKRLAAFTAVMNLLDELAGREGRA